MRYNSIELMRIKRMVIDLVKTFGTKSEAVIVFKYHFNQNHSYAILRTIYESYMTKKAQADAQKGATK